MRVLIAISAIVYGVAFAMGIGRSVIVERRPPPINPKPKSQIQALLDQGRIEDALPLAESLARLSPDDSELLLALAKLYYGKNDSGAFLDMVKKLERKDPGNVEAARLYGVFLAQNNRSEEALRLFGKVLAQRPDDFEVQNAAGVLLWRAGRHAEARAHFENALKIEKNYTTARDNLDALDAQIRATQGNQ